MCKSDDVCLLTDYVCLLTAEAGTTVCKCDTVCLLTAERVGYGV